MLNLSKLILSDGTIYTGYGFGAEVAVSGECVFQIGMVGYVESLTDPSFSNQILVISYPLVGNYGVPDENLVDAQTGIPHFVESNKIHVKGLVVLEHTVDGEYSHWSAVESLSSWLKRHGIPGIFGVDTRSLIKKIRDFGTCPAKIVPQNADNTNLEFQDINSMNLVSLTSDPNVRTYSPHETIVSRFPKTPVILLLNCGMKYNQLRCFLERGVIVKVVPWNHPIIEEPRDSYDGIFLSNGPGNPEILQCTIEQVRLVLDRESKLPDPKPIFGICLGNQILASAVGATTYKLKFGNRGHNQPCIDVTTNRCFLTMQNHGYAVLSETLPDDWKVYFVNANDGTNEGIYHVSKPWFSVQFHPEYKGGPKETSYLFDKFLAKAGGVPFDDPMDRPFVPSEIFHASKVIMLGSGGLSIGQAGEFDYSGSQAIKALRSEGVITILVNPNIATVQTTPELADKVYFVPVTYDYVHKIISQERPDGILLQFGGQTALNCGIELYERGILSKYNVKVLGTSVESIIDTEDRELFASRLKDINERIAPSIAARSIEQAIVAANKIGYPVVIRAGFALGGLGSGFAFNETELVHLAKTAFASSEQLLVEKSLKGWKEIEYEIIRDAYDNCISVCNMENFDPLGIHTGESIVVAPSQTLNDEEYYILRQVAFKVVRYFKIIGECNIQFAYDPKGESYYIVELNARLSRSSALASKATGYPLAYIAAKLAMGAPLISLKNNIIKDTSACSEPSLDYVVVKMPKWDLKKFSRVSTQISTSMKSVGEVMAIGRRFEEAIQKAIRMVHLNRANGFEPGLLQCSSNFSNMEMSEKRMLIDNALLNPSDERIFVIADAFFIGYTVDEIKRLTFIDQWFLYKLYRIYLFDRYLCSISTIEPDDMKMAKQLGFSDRRIAILLNSTESAVRTLRKEMEITPFFKQIDTVAAEFPISEDVNYIYSTYNATESDNIKRNASNKSIIVLGSGSYSIGSSVEFDWCAVSSIHTAKEIGFRTIMINYNPETVSTDYDECDTLYFEELSVERVLDIWEVESAVGVLVSMGGQIPNNIVMSLSRSGVNILGTSADMIETAENRYKFSRMLDSIGIDQPKWKECRNVEEILEFCWNVGFPCLVRPSFVLSGAGMNVVHTETELKLYLELSKALKNKDSPVVISTFINRAKEIDVDAVAQNGVLIAYAICEHVENAGVHSGDATLMLPAQDLDDLTVKKLIDAVRKIALQLNVTGPFNTQFIAKESQIKVIETNLRASRSFPFVSKTLMVDFASLAVKAILGVPLSEVKIDLDKIKYVGFKVPQFSFIRLRGADPVLGVEMTSTGEVACFGKNKYDAFSKAMIAAGFKWPVRKNILLSIGPYSEKMEFLSHSKKIYEQGYQIFGTPDTAEFLAEYNIKVKTVHWVTTDDANDNIFKLLSSNFIDLCIILPSNNRNRRPASFMSNGYLARRMAVDFAVPLITNIKVAKLLVDSLLLLGLDIDKVDKIVLNDGDSRSNQRRCLKLPGLIDVHTHLREPGQEYKEDWETGTEAALAGGITFIGVMPNTVPFIDDSKSFELISNIAQTKAKCDYGLFVGATSANAEAIAALAKSNPILGIKMYLDETFTTVKLSSLGGWFEHFKHWPKDLPICVHSEGKNIAACILLAYLCDRSVHICHVSTKEEINLIKESKAKGLSVTCEVCPHHLFLSRDDAGYLGDGFSNVKPRLGTKEDVEVLWNNIDVIDIIATDHAPHTVEEKKSSSPPPGFPGLETVVPLMLTAVNQNKLTLEQLIQKMYTNPKRIFNLPDQPDTWIEVDLEKKWTIPSKMSHSKCSWTPYEGFKVQGKVMRVVLRSQVVMVNDQVHAQPGYGQNLICLKLKNYGISCAENKISMESEEQNSDLDIPSLMPFSPSIQSGNYHQVPNTTLVSSSEYVKPLRMTKSYNFLDDSPHHNISSQLGKGISIISVKNLTRADLHYIFNTASELKSLVKKMDSLDLLKGKVLANLFYESSTRTSSSFWLAMTKLGGSVIPFYSSSSSVTKGESFEDTVRIMSLYSDVLVIRHPDAGAVQNAVSVSSSPIINAGDGVGEHPSQALLDVFTVRQELGTVNGLEFTIVGDLKNGRTVHSLVHVLSQYHNIFIRYVSPPSLMLPDEIWEYASSRGVHQEYMEHLDSEILSRTDVLYVTRIQKERFDSLDEYRQVSGFYKITPATLANAKERMIVMHPLPRVDEIDPLLDSDPRAAYFRQTENGIYVRMALLAIVLGKS